MLHSAAATCLAFVNAHVGRCLAVLFSVMALKWACRNKSPAIEVSSSPLNPSRHLLTWGAVLLLLVPVCIGANLLGRAPPCVVSYIAVSPSAAAGDVLPVFFALHCWTADVHRCASRFQASRIWAIWFSATSSSKGACCSWQCPSRARAAWPWAQLPLSPWTWRWMSTAAGFWFQLLNLDATSCTENCDR